MQLPKTEISFIVKVKFISYKLKVVIDFPQKVYIWKISPHTPQVAEGLKAIYDEDRKILKV